MLKSSGFSSCHDPGQRLRLKAAFLLLTAVFYSFCFIQVAIAGITDGKTSATPSGFSQHDKLGNEKTEKADSGSEVALKKESKQRNHSFSRRVRNHLSRISQCIQATAEGLRTLICVHGNDEATDCHVVSYVVIFQYGETQEVGNGQVESNPFYEWEFSPNYNDLDITEMLRSQDRELWQRLELDQIGQVFGCDEKSGSASLVSINRLIDGLAGQGKVALGLPCQLDVVFQDQSGLPFNFGCLPSRWLESPDVVSHIFGLMDSHQDEILLQIDSIGYFGGKKGF